MKAKLLKAIDGAVDQQHLLDLLQRRQLTNDTMLATRVHELRIIDQDRPAFHEVVVLFADEANHSLEQRVTRSDEGRDRLLVDLALLEADALVLLLDRRATADLAIALADAERNVVDFPAPFLAALDLAAKVFERLYEEALDMMWLKTLSLGPLHLDTDPGEEISGLFLLEHSVQDGRPTATGTPHIVAERLQFAAIDRNGAATNAGIAPHLNFRPARPEEIARVEDLLQAEWLRTNLEKTAVRFATVELAQKHVAEVKARRIPEIDKVEQEVSRATSAAPSTRASRRSSTTPFNSASRACSSGLEDPNDRMGNARRVCDASRDV